jgi:hypothetical protein
VAASVLNCIRLQEKALYYVNGPGIAPQQKARSACVFICVIVSREIAELAQQFASVTVYFETFPGGRYLGNRAKEITAHQLSSLSCGV